MRTRSKYLLAALLLVVLMPVAGCASRGAKSVAKSGSATSGAVATTDEVKAALASGDTVVVDARDNNAFIGWPLDGVARGGHIDGAVDFSAAWLTVKGEDDKAQAAIDKQLTAALETKGITGAKSVIVYDANGQDAKAVIAYLKSSGVTSVKSYDVKKWAADSSAPMKSYPNYELIVPASYIKDTIEGPDASGVKVFEVSWGKETPEYKKAHIPGAVHIDTDEVEVGPVWNRRSDAELEKFALKNGITADTPVLLYGSDSMPAYRVAAILKYTGVKDVRVLNGAFASWTRAGYKTESGSNPKVAVSSFGTKVPGRDDYIIDMPEAKAILADSVGASLVDNRSWDEHIGKTPGYDDIKEAGRPAGSRWGGDVPADNCNVDGTMRNFDEVEALWAKSGIKPTQKLGFFCGTGWRAAETLIYADVAGLKDIHLYDGGWYEWIMRGKNPKATGDPAKTQ